MYSKDVTSLRKKFFIGKQENIILKTLFIKLYYSLFVQIFYQQILNSHFTIYIRIKRIQQKEKIYSIYIQECE